MQERSGGQYKSSWGFTAEYSWVSRGSNADFAEWCRVGKWLGLNDTKLRKLEPLAIAKAIAEQFPLLAAVRVIDTRGCSGEIVRS